MASLIDEDSTRTAPPAAAPEEGTAAEGTGKGILDDMSPEDRLAYLRERGVEVDLPEDRKAEAAKKAAAAAASGGAPFRYVYIPQAEKEPVVELQAAAGDRDVLVPLLTPHFATDAAMDEMVVRRESLARLKGMVVGGAAAGGEGLTAPSSETLRSLAEGGACEAYPLCMGSPDNNYTDVKLYIDEVGTLRGRPRNSRAEVSHGEEGG